MPDHVMNYVETDLAGGLTLAAWRRSRSRTQPRRRFRPAFAF